MNYNHHKQAALAAGMLASVALAGTANAQTSDRLLNALIKKGVLTESEAKDVQAETKMDDGYAPASTGFLIVNSAVKNLELFGDVRLRYEYRTAETASSTSNGSTLAKDRWRYALRFGLKGEAYDNFYYGLRLETSANPRSTWVTFGGEKISSSNNGTTAASAGPFGKNDDTIGVGLAYVGWKPVKTEDFVTDITLGKMVNPLYTTAMTWDPDLTPEGAAERFTYKSAGGNTGKNAGDLELSANFGQFVYQAVTPTGTGKLPADSFLLAWQLGAKYNFDKDISAKIGPSLYNYTSHGAASGFNSTFIGQGSTSGQNSVNSTTGFFSYNQTGINDLLVLDIPAQVDFKIGKYNARVFGDFALNLNGNARATDAYNASLGLAGIQPITGGAQTDQDKAYQVGFAITNGKGDLVPGKNLAKNTWEFRTYWQHIEQYALDVNLIDSDFFEGRANLEGIYAAVAYCPANNVITTVRYGYADRIDKKLGTGGSNLDLPTINPAARYQLIQLDLTLKF